MRFKFRILVLVEYLLTLRFVDRGSDSHSVILFVIAGSHVFQFERVLLALNIRQQISILISGLDITLAITVIIPVVALIQISILFIFQVLHSHFYVKSAGCRNRTFLHLINVIAIFQL